MLLSNPGFAVSSTPHRMVFQSRSHWTEAEANTNAVIKGKIGLHQIVGSSRNLKFISRSVSEGEALTEYDTPFPNDYIDLLKQAKRATELALKDGKQLMEIEFPTAGLGSVPGDGEGGNELTGSMQLIREFCDILVAPEKVTRTRIFFPEANEVKFARQVFEGVSFKLDYLTKPSFFEDFGFGEKVKMADRVKPEDKLFLVGYPYFNVNEMIVVEELYKEAVMNTNRKMIIFNGELDRIRSGYYPSFFYPKLAALTKSLLPMMETVYYIHNFKGRNGGTLFRCYPGPWRVLRRMGNKYFCVHQQEKMPSLKGSCFGYSPCCLRFGNFMLTMWHELHPPPAITTRFHHYTYPSSKHSMM